MKKTLVLLVALAFACMPALAANFSMSAPLSIETFAGDPISFNIEVTNNGPVTEYYSISMWSEGGSLAWVTYGATIIQINPSSTGTIPMTISPPANTRADTYSYRISAAASSSGDKVTQNILLSVRQKLTAGAVKKLALTCTSCVDEIGATMDVENVGTAILNDAKVVLTAGPLGKELIVGQINSKDVKSASSSFSLKGLEPGDYLVTAELFANAKSLDKVTQPFTIPVVQNIVYDKSVSLTPLGRFTTLKATNNGNDDDTAELKSSVLEQWWISYSGPAPTSKGEEWQWDRTVAAGKTIELAISEYYWPVPAGIIIIAALALFFYMRSVAVTINKSVYSRGEDIYGVSLVVKNKGKPVEGTIVRDVVPDGYEISGQFETIKPIMRKVAEGTELLWKMDVLPTGEERILHYRVKATPYAKPVLPKAVVRGRRGGAMSTVTSSAVGVPLSKERKIKVGFE